MSTSVRNGSRAVVRVGLTLFAFTLLVLLNALVAQWLSEPGVLLALNVLVTPTRVMKEIGRRLVNNWKLVNEAIRTYDGQYRMDGAKVGYTVNARLPQRYQVNKGQALTIQAVQDTIVPITLTDQANIGIEFSTASLTMEIDNYKDRYIAPAVDALVNVCDYDGFQRMYKEVWQTVGTPGVPPGSTGTNPAAANNVYLAAGVKLDNGAVPDDNRVLFGTPSMHMYLSSANQGLFNPSRQLSESFRKGMFGADVLGFERLYKAQNVAVHTVGALGGTPLVNGANQTGSSLVTDGWSNSITGVLKQGDVIQLAGVFAVNPLSYQSTGQLQDLVVMADVNSSGAGAATISIKPAIIVSGPQQTVTNSPADNAAVTIFGHATAYAAVVTPQGLAFHPDAFAFVMADLELPGGLWVAERISNKALGIAVRFLKDYSIMTDQSPARLDILYGWKAVRPELAVRIAS